jgi:hypothetical protein
MILMFQLNVETALTFWERVMATNANTEEERQAILLNMCDEGLIKSVVGTNRTKTQIIADFKTNFGDVLDLTQKGEGE